jgi:hypothetical protein
MAGLELREGGRRLIDGGGGGRLIDGGGGGRGRFRLGIYGSL